MTRPEVILASGSSSRRAMLTAAGIAFTAITPDIDEDELRAKMPPTMAAKGDAVAGHLAERKALAVSARHPNALVVGCDQVLVCEGRLFNKAVDEKAAGATLRALRGRTHELISAAVIAKGEALTWRCTDVARLQMRMFSDEFLERLSARRGPGHPGLGRLLSHRGARRPIVRTRGRRPVHDPRPPADPAACGAARTGRAHCS